MSWIDGDELDSLRRELAAAKERIAYLESITTGAEHKAIDSAIASQAPDPSPDAQ